MPVHRMEDPERIFASLSTEAEKSALLAAFLGTFGDADAAWTWRAGGATNISFLIYLTHTSFSPILFGYGPPTGIENLLDAARSHLPDRLRLHFPVEHRGAVERFFFHAMKPDRIFALGRGRLDEPPRRVKVVELGEGDSSEIAELFTEYPDNFFQPQQLRDGMHLGVREGGKLVAFASAPIVSPRFARAAVSNVITRKSHRGKGIARALNHALARQLFERGVEYIGLGVFEGNESARSLFESLGYHSQYRVLFGPGTVRGRATPSPSSLSASASVAGGRSK